MLTVLVVPYAAFIAVTVMVVLWKGGPPERLGAASIIAMTVVQQVLERISPSGFIEVDVSSVVTDVLGFLSFGTLALYARRIWPLWAVALQILCLCAHVARWASLSISPAAYALARGAPTAMILVLMLGATLLTMRSRARGDDDRAWQDWAFLRRRRQAGLSASSSLMR